MNLADRVAAYNSTFGTRFTGSALVMNGSAFHGVWMLGNNYRGSGFYGAYPPAFLKRTMALFEDKKHVMHLFSGSLLPSTRYTRVDLKGGDVLCDAHRLSSSFREGSFDLVLADPPYSPADAEHYGTKMIDRRKVMREVAYVLSPRGHLVWLDTTWPMVKKDLLRLVGTVGILRSCNHRVRFAFVFERA